MKRSHSSVSLGSDMALSHAGPRALSGAKHVHPVEDAGDRAQKHRKAGLVRISLDRIAFWPDNRGGMGLSSHHVHEVAWDCKTNKTKLQRYGHVDIIEVPRDKYQEIFRANQERCEADPLMPRFAPAFEYVCASKTHFTHAHKLAKDGNRSIFNQGEVPIRWGETDHEGQLIIEQGPLCAIYHSQLLHDLDAATALASDDNLNAAVQLVEDEMQAFGRVDAMFNRMALSQDADKNTIDGMMASLQVAGLGQFSNINWRDFIALRSCLTPSIAKVLQTCQFNACAGRVRVKAADFRLTAKLDPRAPWSMVAIMLSQYLSVGVQNLDKPASSGLTTFTGIQVQYVAKLNADVMKERQYRKAKMTTKSEMYAKYGHEIYF